MFPEKIKEFIYKYDIKEITNFHRSGDLVYCIEEKYILKVSKNVDRLKNEYNKDIWVNNYIASPKPIIFIIEKDIAYYLREFIVGENLCFDKYLNEPLALIDLLVEAINTIHNIKVNDKKYIIDENYDTLIHGDFCLPNILINNNKISGFIDLGDAGIGDPWRDYAWCIWSLEYNLKTNKYTPILLEKLNITFDKEKYEKYTK